MLFNTVFNIKLLKIDQKTRIFKKPGRNLVKSGKNFEKMSGNPVIVINDPSFWSIVLFFALNQGFPKVDQVASLWTITEIF